MLWSILSRLWKKRWDMTEPKSLESPSLKAEMSRKIGNAELAPHFFVIQPSWVFQPFSCIRSPVSLFGEPSCWSRALVRETKTIHCLNQNFYDLLACWQRNVASWGRTYYMINSPSLRGRENALPKPWNKVLNFFGLSEHFFHNRWLITLYIQSNITHLLPKGRMLLFFLKKEAWVISTFLHPLFKFWQMTHNKSVLLWRTTDRNFALTVNSTVVR